MLNLVTTPDHDVLAAAVGDWTGLAAADAARLAAAFERREVAGGEAVALPGDARHEVLFVARGLLRFYYPGADGREANKAFVAEGAFAGAIAAATLDVPILYGIEALEDSVVLAAPYARLDALMTAHAPLERFGRRLAERILARKERRARSLLLESATERYLDFCDAEPDLVQRVPQRHIASLLGMTDVHLSRVRRALAEASSGDGARDGVLNLG